MAAIEVRQVRLERLGDIGVRDVEELGLIAPGREVRRDRRLPVERRVDVADFGEPRDLCGCGGADLPEVAEVDVVARHDAEIDGRIDVEAIDRRVVCGDVGLDHAAAVGEQHGRRELAATRILTMLPGIGPSAAGR